MINRRAVTFKSSILVAVAWLAGCTALSVPEAPPSSSPATAQAPTEASPAASPALAPASAPAAPEKSPPPPPPPVADGGSASPLEELLRGCASWTAEQARQRPAMLCPEGEDLVPHASSSFPAIAAEGARVAVLVRDHDCCSDMSRITAEVRTRNNVALHRWLLVDRDDSGVDSVAAGVAVARVQALNERLLAGQFRPMERVFGSAHGMTSAPVPLGGGLSARLDGARFEVSRGAAPITALSLPSFTRDSDCCDGGLGLGGTCQVPSTPDAVWRRGHVLVISAGAIHQRDGCDGSPAFFVVEIPTL